MRPRDGRGRARGAGAGHADRGGDAERPRDCHEHRASVDKALEQIEAGATLTRDELLELADSPDILAAGMLADAQRRVRHGSAVTYLRVATCAFDALASPPPAAAGGGELRLTGAPASLTEALQALRHARVRSPERGR